MARSEQTRGRRRPLIAFLPVLLLLTAISACGKSATLPHLQNREAAPVERLGSTGLETRNTSRLGGADVATDAAAVSRAVYPGLTQASRPAAVVLVEDHDWAAALAASALAGEPLRAPLLYEQSQGQLPAVSSVALRAMRPRGSSQLGGAQVLVFGSASAPAGYRARRVGSDGPSALAASVAGLLEKLSGERAKRVIIVNPEAPRALAMPATGLAAESDAPILFATAKSLPSATRSALERMKRPAIYVVGPKSAIGPPAMAALRRLGHVRRISGGHDPVSNAVAAAEYEKGGFGWGVQEPGHGLVFLNAGRPFDAPAAASLSATGEYGPQLLLEVADRIPPTLARYLGYIQPGYAAVPEYQPVRGVYNHGWLIGDGSAITATVQAELDDLLEIAPRDTSESNTTTTE